MHKLLYIIGLGTLAVSCSAQNASVISKNNTVTANPEMVAEIKPLVMPPSYGNEIVKKCGYEFFTKNIGDIAKNDNTASFGSIVSAEPKGYKVSKNYFPAMNQNFRIRYVILHYTALPDDKSVTVLTGKGVSAHYLVNNMEDNEIYQLVDENKRAYHAGISSWRNDKSLNDTSIGIEIVNDGYKIDSLGMRVFPSFSDVQIKKVASLVQDILMRYSIPITNILAHSDIAPTRKHDPGPAFPWKKLYDEYKIGMWYDEQTKQNLIQNIANSDFFSQVNTSPFIFKFQTALQKFGYDIMPTGMWDKENVKVVQAFQYHFRPEKYDGIVDMETWAILQALQLKYPNK